MARTPCIIGLQAAGARGLRPRSGRAGGSATPTSYTARASIDAVNALTFEVDPSVGAGHPHNWQFGTALQLFHFGNERYPNGS